MSKRGFTLVELLAVLVLLSVIVLVAFPNILSAFRSTDDKVNANTEELLKANARSYVNDTPSLQVENGCVTVKTLIENSYTQSPIANVSNSMAETIANSWGVQYTCKNAKCKEFTINKNSCR